MAKRIQATVLLLGAKSTKNPLASIPKELSYINEVFEANKSDSLSFQIKHQPYLTRAILSKQLERLANQVAILHFAGHSDKHSLQTDDEQVYSQHIANILNTWTIPPSLIFLNGCHNAEQVQLFLDAGIGLVIATHRLIDDQQAFDRAGEHVFMGQAAQPRSFDMEELEYADNDTAWDWGLFPKNTDHLQQWTIRHLLENNRPVFDQHGKRINPYKGLESFKEKDQAWFFGRKVLTTELSQQIPQERFFSLLGASGSGKSSLINAGVIPQLRERNNTLILQTRPTQTPFKELARPIAQILYPDSTVKRLNEQKALAESLQTQQLLLSELIEEILRQRDKSCLVLCIDQFEELFTHSETPLIQSYLDQLVQVIDSNTPCTVLLIMRADFLGAALGYPKFAARMDQYPDKKLSAMSKAELRAAIEKPANKQHVKLEHSLIEALLDDVENQAGSLPLLQYVLSLLWKKRKNNLIQLEDYTTFGGLEKALESRANSIYQSFSETQKVYCKQIFLRLINPGEGTEDTRRRASLSEFNEATESHAIIKILADARLITTQQNQQDKYAFAEVSHEVLIRHWSQLQEWIAENRNQLRTQHQISATAKEWQEHNKDAAWLLSGTRLTIAEDWLTKNSKQATRLEVEFIQKGLDERDSKQKQQAVQQQRELQLIAERKKAIESREKEQQIALKKIRKRTAIMLLITLVMIAVASLAWTYYQEAEKAKQEAGKANQEAKEKLLESNYNLAKVFEQKIQFEMEEGNEDKSLHNYRKAWLYALEAESIPMPEGKKALQQSVLNQVTNVSVKTLDLVNTITRPTDFGLNAISYSPDKNTFVAGSVFDTTIKLWNAKTGKLQQTLKGHKKSVYALTYSRDGQVLASGSKDGTIKLWNAKTGRLQQTLKGHKKPVYALTYSRDGQVLTSGSNDGTIKLWNPKTGEFQQTLKGHQGSVNTLHYSQDGFVLTSTSDDKTIKSWIVKTDNFFNTKQITKYKNNENLLISNHDGYILASILDYRTIELQDIKTEKFQQIFTEDEESFITAMSYSPHDHKLVLSTYDGIIKLYDIKTGKLKHIVKTNKEWIMAVSYNPHKHVLASSSGSEMIQLWDVNTGALTGELKGYNGWITALNYSSDGHELASGSYGGIIKLWDTKTNKLKQTLTGHKEEIIALNYSPDGYELASASKDDVIQLWDTKTGKLKKTLNGHKGGVASLSYSRNNHMLASSSKDGTIKLWDKYVLMTQDIFYKYDPKQVSMALQFLWEMTLDKGTLSFIYQNRTSILYPDKDKFMPLLAMPKQGELKADQLVQWLKARCAYKDRQSDDAKQCCATRKSEQLEMCQ